MGVETMGVETMDWTTNVHMQLVIVLCEKRAANFIG